MGHLQALTVLTDWAQEWQLGISIDRCCVLNLGIQLSAPHLFINNSELDVVLQARDLGILVSDSLSPTAHELDIASKAHRRAKLILRTFTSQDIGLLIRAYVVYVRPLVEHNSIVWSPYTIEDIKTIECVQRRFTKNLRGCSGYSYLERLRRLELQSLEHRRLLFDLIFCYKIVFGIVDVPMDDFFSFSTWTLTRAHKFILYKKTGSLANQSKLFSERVINAWNSLPVNIVDFSTLSRFKCSISKVDFTSLMKRFWYCFYCLSIYLCFFFLFRGGSKCSLSLVRLAPYYSFIVFISRVIYWAK